MSRFTIERTYSILLLLFFASGCAALVYEVVWFEMLRQVVGASSYSIAIVLTSYMAGLALGSYGFARWTSTKRHPLRVYAALELGIAILGLLVLIALPMVRNVYIAAVDYGATGIFLRAAVCLVCLLPPTILMGATLPAAARWMDTSGNGVSGIGFLYALNIFGAVTGTLLAGFYFLPTYDLTTATIFAVVLNGLAAVVAFAIAAPKAPGTADCKNKPAVDSVHQRPNWTIYWVIGLSGLTALGAQVVWTRLVSMLFGASVYSFSIILAVFLGGLGIGSAIGARLAGRRTGTKLKLAVTQFGLVIAVPFAALAINSLLPHWQSLHNDSLAQVSFSPWFDLLRGSAALLPATLLWGASFPLAMAVAATHKNDPGELVGGVYAANTVGAIVGALGFSLLVIPMFGTEVAQQLIVVIAGLSAILALSVASDSRLVTRHDSAPSCSQTLMIISIAAIMILVMPSTETRLIGFGHDARQWSRDNEFVHVSEGRSASLAVSTSETSGYRYFHVNGKVVASNMPIDMRLQRMLGHLPALFHSNPKSVLIVGFGAGVTAGSFVHYPGVEKIVICEIEPRVIDAARRYFSDENRHVLDDPRVEVIYDDARHYIATTNRTFDIITSDPLHPWVKGAAALYSMEYFEETKRRLNPGGIVTQWVPLYQTNERAVKSQVATFSRSFADVTIWHSNLENEGYDLVLLGMNEPLRVDVGHVRDTLDALPGIRRALEEAGINSLTRLLGSFTATGIDVRPWLETAEINQDRSLRLQYLAGIAAGRYESNTIYRSISRYREYPEEIFQADERTEDLLRRQFEENTTNHDDRR